MPFPAIEIKSQTLDNGLVFSGNESMETDSIALTGSIKAGAIYDKLGKFGTAEFVSRLLTRGTRSNVTSPALSERIEAMGATVQFTNEDERVRFRARCHSSNIREMIKILAECLMTPLFSPDQVELTKAEIISNIEEERDDTRTIAHRQLMSLVYGEGKPFGRNSMGEVKDIKTISREDILNFYNENYAPNTTLIVATGRFVFSDLLSQIDRELGNWNAKSKANPVVSPENISSYGIAGVPKIISMNYKNQVDIAIGMRGVARKSDQYYALSLGNLLLGQIGLYGRLGKNVREEKGVAYYSFSSLVARSLSGHIAIYAGVNPKNTNTAIEGIAEELSRIQFEEIAEEEMTTGKRNALGSLSISLDTSFERVGIVHEIEYYDLGGSKYFEEFENRITSVTSGQVLKAFAEFASPSHMSMALAGPVQNDKQIRTPGELLGKAALS